MPSVFISYSRKDTRPVKDFVDDLRDKYYKTWFDQESIPGGTDWRREIEKGIEQANCVLLMLSPDSCDSSYVKEEVDYARSLGRRIIPIKIRLLKEPDDLNKLGVAAINYVDFTPADTRAAWEKLLNPETLPPPLPREVWLLDPSAQARHRRYLNTLFHRYGTVSLNNLLDETPREQVNLFDVYVPLKLGVSFNIEVRDGEMVDWWLRDQDSPRMELDEAREKLGDRFQPKALRGFEPAGPALPYWVQEMEAGWQRFKQKHTDEQAEKPKDRRESLKDGTYYWNRIESEQAPALCQHLVITGDPGSGKSTLLCHLALSMAEDLLYEGDEEAAGVGLARLGFWPLPAYTPVYIELRALVQQQFPDVRDEVTLEKFLLHLQAQLKPYDCLDCLDDLKMLLEEGSAMIFLDGLDEVPQAGETKRREQIKELVRLLSAQYRHCRILIASRPYAYAGDWKLEGFGEVRLAYLDSDRMEQLALSLFTVVLGAEAAEAQAEQFKERVGELPERIRRSPLFFTLLAGLWLNSQGYEEEKRLPLDEGAIYRECVELMLRRWTRKDLDKQSLAELANLSDDELRLALQDLAFTVHHSQDDSEDPAVFTEGTVVDAVKRVKKRGVDYDRLIDHLGQRAGVLYEFDPDGRYRFAHLSFQEYLAAAYLAQPGHYPAVFLDCLQDSPERWRNVAALFPDEVKRQKGSLWDAVKAVLPSKNVQLPHTGQDNGWWPIFYSAQWMATNLPQDDDLQEVYRPRLQMALTALVEAGGLPPKERAEAGRRLDSLGDPRPGVGVLANGLPDIAWGKPLLPGVYPLGHEDEGDNPPREFELTYSYRLSKYPMTYRQFEAFVTADDGFKDPRWWEGLAASAEHRDASGEQKFKYWNHPRENVSWYDAMAFCRWLSWRLTGRCYGLDEIEAWPVRLPTENEWEIAARGEDGRLYPYESEFDARKGNTEETGIDMTSAAGIFPDGASPCGLLDMSGNVWEWCLTEYTNPPSDATTSGENLQSDTLRVIRGGSWGLNRGFARAVSRLDLNLIPDARLYILGFRVCGPPS